MKWAVLVALVSTLALAETEKPHLIASVHLVPFTSFPDLLGAQVTVHAIPFVDLQAGVSGFVDRVGWWARCGFRYLLDDWRDDQQRGLTWRVALLAGVRSFRDPRATAFGFSGTLNTDLAWFFSPHLGLSFQLALGGLYDAPGKRVLPELRLGVGLCF